MSSAGGAITDSDNTPKSAPIGRNNFDFCRFWLAVLVIFSHSFALVEGDERNEPIGIFTHGQIGSGRFAVNCFFAISGFLITHSWLRSTSTANFLLKRILRIYPGFVVAVLIGLFIVGPFATENFGLSKPAWLTLPVFLVALRSTEPIGAFANNPVAGAINGSLWTIPFEFKCYLALMLMGFIGLLSRYKKATISLFAITVLGSFFYPMVANPALDVGAFAGIFGGASEWALIFPWFVAGVTFYLFRDQIKLTPVLMAFIFAITVVASFLPPVGHLVFPFGITYLLFWFALYSPIHFDHWARYGDFSYGIYLYAFPIQQLIVMNIPGISPIQLFLVSTPLSIIAGIMSWHLIEKHFMKLKPKPLTPAN